MTDTLDRNGTSSWRELPTLDPEGDEPGTAAWHGIPLPFLKTLGGVVALAAVVRLVFILGAHQEFPLWGDAWVYHHQARFIGNGHWFIQPTTALFSGTAAPAADHPPLFTLVLSVGYLLGVRAPVGQMLINAGLGVITVALIGLIGRRLGGNRVGLIAATIAAVYPNLWGWNGQVLSESLSALTLAATLFFAYRYIDGRRLLDLGLTAAMAALATLSRSELLLLFPLLVLPMIVSEYRRTHDTGQLLRLLAVAGGVSLAIIAPWSAYNLSRFEQPAILGNGLGRALDSGACDQVMKGDDIGFWTITCLDAPMGLTKEEQAKLDESQLDKAYREDAVKRYTANPGQTLAVLAVRPLRMFHLYAPLQQLDFDQLTEGREWWLGSSGWTTFYLLAGFSIAGGIALRRRMRIMYPLVVPIVIAVFGAMIAFGTTRYRAPAEVAFVLLAAVGAEWAVQALERRARERAAARQVIDVAPDGAATVTALDAPPYTIKTVLAGVVVVIAVVGGLGMWISASTGHDHEGFPAQVPAPAIPDR